MLATGLFCGFYILRADLRRRSIRANPLAITVWIGVAGFVVSKLYKIIDTPSVFLAHPLLLVSQYGFTFYGAVIGGAGAAVILARYYRLPLLTLLDAVSPGVAIGYGLGRIGCFLAGDGDYGVPTSLPWGMSFPHGLVPTVVPVHPTPLYEFAGAALIATYLWKCGQKSAEGRIPPGRIFAEYLLLTGAARFLVEFIRRNPRGWLGLTNAQQVAILSVAIGLILLLTAKATRKPQLSS